MQLLERHILGLGKHLINFDQIFMVETLDILVSSRPMRNGRHWRYAWEVSASQHRF